MITRAHFKFERTIVRYAYAREDDITAVVALLGEHEQSAVLGTAVVHRVGDVLTAMRIINEGLRLRTQTILTHRQSGVHIEVVTLGVHTALPRLRSLTAHVLKAEEVILFVVILGIHLERITRPSTDILIATQGACKDAIRGSGCQIREYHMRRIYHDTFRVIQIGRNIANERIFRFRNDNKLPTRIGLAGRCKSNLNGVIRSTDRFQLRCITGSHKFEGDIIQPIIVFSRRNIRDTGGKHEIIIRQFILAQIHLATREGCTGGQVEGLQQLEGGQVVHIRHDTYVELRSAACAVRTGIEGEFEVRQVAIHFRHYHIAVTPEVDTLRTIRRDCSHFKSAIS